ncbi:hypothetical protein [Priestia megaterium]|uniref:hypothetical protein n=1 Tax=Priestia megaterium TaxID=1404 RepID=UPI000BF6F120|nr:hypothetical protein [Priestia megaterium]PFW43823.1 hypothetical protein COL17_26825 [Priestia megaterium]
MGKVTKVLKTGFDEDEETEVKAESVAEQDEKVNAARNAEEEAAIKANLQRLYEEQNARELKGEIRGNYTLVVEHALMDRLNALAEHYERGFKSDLVNEALKTFIELYEKRPLPAKKKKTKSRR